MSELSKDRIDYSVLPDQLRSLRVSSAKGFIWRADAVAQVLEHLIGARQIVHGVEVFQEVDGRPNGIFIPASQYDIDYQMALHDPTPAEWLASGLAFYEKHKDMPNARFHFWGPANWEDFDYSALPADLRSRYVVLCKEIMWFAEDARQVVDHFDRTGQRISGVELFVRVGDQPKWILTSSYGYDFEKRGHRPTPAELCAGARDLVEEYKDYPGGLFDFCGDSNRSHN